MIFNSGLHGPHARACKQVITFSRYCVLYDRNFILTGSNANTMKVHLLNHIVSCVCEWGPLWVYSCFHYEAMNHSIKKLFHGSRNSSEEVYIMAHNCIHFSVLLDHYYHDYSPAMANLVDRYFRANYSIRGIILCIILCL